PPETEDEKTVFELLSDILGHKSFGVDTDFSDAGLTSVSAIRFAVRLGKTFGRSFSNGDLENHPTVRELAKFASEGQNGTARKAYEKLESYPLTKTQEGVFVECLTKPGSTAYNIPVLFALDPAVDPGKLKKAVEKAIDAHRYVMSVLITDENGDVRARPDDGIPDVRRIPGDLPDAKDLLRPFEMIGHPLYRAEIYETPNRPYLFLDFHHVLFDGTSMAVLLSDISEAYLGHPVEKETYSGYEIALDEEEARQSSLYGDAKQYFASLLAETDGDYLPKKALRTGEKENRSVRRSFAFDRKSFDERVRKDGLSADAIFNYFFGLTMTKYICRDDALYCAAYSGRSDTRRANVASMLVKTLPVYLKTDPEDDLVSGVRAMKKQLDASRAFSVYSFAEIASATGVTAELLFVYQGDFFKFDRLCGLPAESKLIPSSTPKAALTFQVSVDGDRVLLDLDYDGSVYDEPLVTAFARTFETLFRQFGSVKKVGELDCLSDEDRKMYDAFNATDEETRDCAFHKLFEEQVLRVPDKTAVFARDGSYTFRELNEAANRIAHALIDAGIQKGDFVAVVMPRVKDAYSARHGVLKAGAAFVPIDPKYPDDRISYILESANAKAVISTKEVFEQKPDAFNVGSALRMDANEMLKTADCSNPDVPVGPSDMCYVIYTSGSTGKPKGVMIRHRNLVNYVADGNNPNTLPHRRAGENAVVGCFASLSFDASLLEEAPALARGLTMVMASESEIENPILYAKTMIEKGVTLCFFTPSYVANALICKEFMEALKGLKGLMMGAEALPRDLYVNLREAGIDTDIYNIYGPTETTICCTHATVTEPFITIGKPVANTKHYIMDKRGKILPIGAVGDLCICGNGVGAGYLNLPEMTAAKYITVDGLPAFRSGDIVRFNSEGNIEYFGRLDNQIKLHGLRIELDEIEKAIAAYPGVARAVVRVCKAEEDYLAGYFTASETVDKQALTAFISSSLTPYMVPKILIQLDRMPLNPNGKIDKKALPEPVLESGRKDVKQPKNETEEKIVRLFRKALSRKEYGTDENFFDQGGTSLSVSKIAMMALTEGLPVAYRDVFDYPTPELLAAHILSTSKEEESPKSEKEETGEEALAHNCVRYVDDTSFARPLGRVLLTGATGFLGAHVLKQLLDKQIPTVVLCRGGELDAETKVLALLAYYFDSPMEDAVASLVKAYDADITSERLPELLKDEQFDTVVNCAAMVKHFAADDIIERVNVGGVKNMILLAKEKNARLVQISTLSVAGENVDGKFPETFRLHENELSVGQDVSNKYVHSKYMGEKAILEAVAAGLDAKIIRVGNLMGRQEDGEFQINSVTNSFIRNLRAYRALGCFPVSACDGTVDFSPIDEVAKAVLLLAQTDRKFTVYHCANAHEVQMGDVIEAMNRCGFRIAVVPDETFNHALSELLKDEEKNMLVSGLLTYSSGGRQLREFIRTDNRFTVKALYRLGYKWPITDELYLTRVIEALDSLGFFDRDDM
ncbi:MAG: amino acid adenylation domain-containing protein, partial [Clostridia bacterium]|nr:amino acid adenylation domain-containing protein [Clostridia bacterium]